jgi:hypothetical protein
MNAKKLFDDDDVLFEEPSSDRASHVELRVDRPEPTLAEEHFARVPRLTLRPRDLALLPLDHREGFLLSMIDGVTSIETILDVCAMPHHEALEILESLVQRGVLVIPR